MVSTSGKDLAQEIFDSSLTRTTMNKLSLNGLAISVALAFSAQAQAAIVTANASITGAGCTGPSVSQAAPGSVGTNATNSNCIVNVFAEAQNTATTSAIQHDPVNLTAGSGISTANGSSLASGTLVNSYLINFQPSAVLGRTATGSVTFTDQILAVVYSNFGTSGSQGFTNTSYLQGSPGYTYGQIFGLETALPGDSFSVNGNTINFSMLASSLGGDNLRVITAVPAPASIALLGLGAVGLMTARRKKAQSQA
jgi:PEP-CTERM motif